MALKTNASSIAFPVALSCTTGMLSTFLGLIVLAGWYTGSETLIQVLPRFVPMQFNTALCFLMCGISLLLITRNKLKQAAILAAVPVAIGFFTLIEYITNINLGIDELLMKHWITVETSHPGRMAPNTALCFILTGSALGSRYLYARYTSLPWLLHALGSLVLGLAGVALLGYITGLECAYGWASMTRMAIHTAAGFLALGTGVLCLPYVNWKNEPDSLHEQRPGMGTRAQKKTSELGNNPLFAFIACFVILLGIISISIWNHSSSLQNNIALHRSHQVNLKIADILAVMTDIETGERGYALTGDERFLAPYNTALDHLQAHLDSLRKEINDNPDQIQLYSKLVPLIDQRLAWAKGTIQTRMLHGNNPTIERVASGQGQRLTEDIRNIIHEMKDYENKKTAEYYKQSTKSVSITTAAMGAGFTLILTMALVIGFRVRQHIRERLKTEQALRDHAETLERFNDLAVGRELRILSLKEEINNLCKELNISPRFNELTAIDTGETPDEILLDNPDPEETISVCPITLKALFCSPVLASVLDSFSHAVGIGAMIMDMEGNVLISIRRQKICTEFHDSNEQTRKHCIGHNQELASRVISNKPFTIYNCPNGLTDAIAPIRILGNHVANIVVGQYLTTQPDYSTFENAARTHRFASEDYIAAVKKVPVFSDESLKPILQFLKGFAELIVEIGLERSKTHNALHHAQKAIQNERQQRTAALSLAEDAQRARRDLQKANEELNRRNAELDEFAFVASHDLQEPLRKLISFGKLLSMDLGGDLPEKAAKDLQFITDAANRMQALVQDLLSLSRTGRAAMKHEEVALDDCVDAALQALAARIEDKQATIVRDALPTVTGDPTLLTQLYQNLIGNALKFMPYGKQPEIHITAELHNGIHILGVRDNGLGIKQEYIEMIFVPFKRLHGRGEFEGSGIGLSICRKVVERHAGGICVESEPGFGSHFKFTLHGPLENDACRKEMANLPSSCS